MKEPTSFKIERRSFGNCLPSISKLPFVGAVSPKSIFIVVDFPAPFGPKKP